MNISFHYTLVSNVLKVCAGHLTKAGSLGKKMTELSCFLYGGIYIFTETELSLKT